MERCELVTLSERTSITRETRRGLYGPLSPPPRTLRQAGIPAASYQLRTVPRYVTRYLSIISSGILAQSEDQVALGAVLARVLHQRLARESGAIIPFWKIFRNISKLFLYNFTSLV